jgi:hypothetical protein
MAFVGLSGLGLLLWAVPGLALSVPGLLVVLAVVGQAASGLVWLPIVRRRIGSFGLHGTSRAR